MKLNKETLMQIIKEELEAVLSESRLLDRYSKDKEEEFRQYLRDMGKDPDEIIDALGPAQADVMRQTIVGNFPKSLDDMPNTIQYSWEPDSPDSPSGTIGLYGFVPETQEIEFLTAYKIQNLEDELERLRKQHSKAGEDAILIPFESARGLPPRSSMKSDRVSGGEQILKMLKIMGEREKPSGLHATPTGKVQKRDHGAFGVGYDAEFKWSDGETYYTSMFQMGDKISFSGHRGRYTLKDAIRLIDTQEVFNYD